MSQPNFCHLPWPQDLEPGWIWLQQKQQCLHQLVGKEHGTELLSERLLLFLGLQATDNQVDSEGNHKGTPEQKKVSRPKETEREKS